MDDASPRRNAPGVRAGHGATIRWISGPVMRATVLPDSAFRLREAIRVGPQKLLGEVIRVQQDEIVAQVYEDTTGLRPGVMIEGSGELLGIAVGPHLLGDIFDGLLRPLRAMDAQGQALPHAQAHATCCPARRRRVRCGCASHRPSTSVPNLPAAPCSAP
jgi:vacuolar-type H+-ATPase subunit B/Vma2